MFYCQKCGDKNKWPTDFYLPQSRGPCECCGKTAACFAVASRRLPDAKRRPTIGAAVKKG